MILYNIKKKGQIRLNKRKYGKSVKCINIAQKIMSFRQWNLRVLIEMYTEILIPLLGA